MLLKAWQAQVQLSNGQTSIREWIDHPGASAVIALFENGDTLLVRQFRYPPRRTFLELPAGKFDRPEEAPEALALRELEEETGWKAAKMTSLGFSYPCIGYGKEVIHYFPAEQLTPGKMQLDHGEMLDVARMPLSDMLRKARRGELFDMKTVFGLIRAGHQLGL